MAISKNITLANGLTINNAYIRIDTVKGFKGGIDYSINSYASQDAFKNGKGYLEQDILHFVPSVLDNAPNFIKQAYEDAKKTDKYGGGIDILEEAQTV